MSRYEEFGDDWRSGPRSFRLERKQASDIILAVERATFGESFPGYFLIGRTALGLISHHEIRAMITNSGLFPQMTLSDIVSRTMNPSAVSAKQEPELSVKDLQYTPARGGRRYKIQIILEDEQGVLEEEREHYLSNLSRFANTSLASRVFVPDVTIGRVRLPADKELSLEPLQYLEPMIPGRVKLKKVTPAYPDQ